MLRQRLPIVIFLLASLWFQGCASSPENKKELGVKSLLLIGDVRRDLFVGGETVLRVMVVQSTDEEQVDSAVIPDYPVSFEIVSTAGGELSAENVKTDQNGLASVTFTANEVGEVQIKVSAPEVESKYFTISVLDRQVDLEPMEEDIVTFIHRRITVSVKATSVIPGQQKSPLAGAKVRFKLNTTTTAKLGVPGQEGQDVQAEVMTNGDGIASVFLFTGDASGQATIEVSMEGAATVGIRVTINDSSMGGPCQTSADCGPDAPICVNGECVSLTEGCTTDDECPGEYKCDTNTGNCVPPETGPKRCNPLSDQANQCPNGQVCIDGYCQDPNLTCQTNDDCSAGMECVDGRCLYPDGGCTTNNDCPGGQACLNGTCVDIDSCYPPNHNPRRLGGTWNFDSLLHLDEAVGGFTGAILGAAEVLRDIMLGRWSISGLPGWLVNAINDLLQQLIADYIPPWAQEAIMVLGDINDILDDMRVYSTVNLIPLGNNEYYGAQHWDLVSFEFRGQQVQTDPANVFSNTGNFEVDDFSSREICGVFYIDRFYVRNGIGGLLRWAVDAAVTGVTCTSENSECYYSLEELLEDAIDCDAIAEAFNDMVHDMWPNAPDAYGTMQSVCENYKNDAINQLIDALNEIEVKFKMMSLRGTANIIDLPSHQAPEYLGKDPRDPNSEPGHWYGTFTGASGIFLGDYTGEFNAVKQ